MRDVYIINPKAGKRDAAVFFIERAKAYHAAHGGEYEIRLTERSTARTPRSAFFRAAAATTSCARSGKRKSS